MADYLVDKQDLTFCLFDQFDLAQLVADYEAFADFDRESLEMILDEAIRFAQDVVAPTNAVADLEGCALVDGQVHVPECYVGLWEEFKRGGWIAASAKTTYGGMGLPFPLAITALELNVGACLAFLFFPGLNYAGGHLIENFGSLALKETLTPRLYSGQWCGTMCLTEPQAGTALGDIRTSATPIEGEQEGTYLIKGQKIFISAGDHQLAENIIHLVLARVPGDPEGTRGISLFAVPKHRYDANGDLTGPNDVAVTALEHKMGIHGAPTCSLSFGDEDACLGYLIGERTRGLPYMFQMMNEARIACAAQGVGGANAAYQLALAYAKERVQGTPAGRRDPGAAPVAIIEHPNVRRNLMLARSTSEGIRALLLSTAFHAARAEHDPDEAKRTHAGYLLDLLTPICKAYCSDQGFRVAEIAVQIHGGYGYIHEYGVEQYVRDLKIASIYEGTNGIQALDLLGRKMRIKGGALFMTWLQDANAFLQQHAEHKTLGDLVKTVEGAKNTLTRVAFGFVQRGQADPEHALLGATPFLEMFGHVEVGRLLLHQALVAHARLAALLEAEDVTTAEAKAAFIKDHPSARFFDAKIKTARFFAANQLQLVDALANMIEHPDRSALDVVF